MSRNGLDVVFIAGSSYSGSTILGLVLGSYPEVFNAGEINKYAEIKRENFKTDPKKEINSMCSCGESYAGCPFWGNVYRQYDKEIDFNLGPGFSKHNLVLMSKILNPFSHLTSPSALGKEYIELIKTIKGNLPENCKVILDDSKSIHNLCLLVAGGANVKVVYLVRDAKETINSFKKHGLSFTYGLASWVLTNLFSRLFLWRTKTSYIKVTYEELCNEPVVQLERLGKFIGRSDKTADYVQRVRNTKFHVIAGNPLLNEEGNIREFEGIKKTGSESLLTRREETIAALVATICRPLVH